MQRVPATRFSQLLRFISLLNYFLWLMLVVGYFKLIVKNYMCFFKSMTAHAVH